MMANVIHDHHALCNVERVAYPDSEQKGCDHTCATRSDQQGREPKRWRLVTRPRPEAGVQSQCQYRSAGTGWQLLVRWLVNPCNKAVDHFHRFQRLLRAQMKTYARG